MSPNRVEERVILDAAMEEFAERGFEGARVDAIAERAGVNKAMLYYRIGGKEELYRRVVLMGQDAFFRVMMRSMQSTGSAPETIAFLLDGLAKTSANNSFMPSIILREIAGNWKTMPEDGMKSIKEFFDSIKSVVTMGIEEKTLRKIDPIVFKFIIIGAIFMLSLSVDMRKQVYPENPGPTLPEQIAESIKDILLYGVLRGGTKA